MQLESTWQKEIGDPPTQLCRGGNCVYPKQESILRAFDKTPFASVKLLIMGQDPYHGEGEADGLAFSVPKGVRLPPSLRNIFKELERDLGVAPTPHGDLAAWAEQGVLLLNATLTVDANTPGSHRGRGWERFTDKVIEALNRREDPVIFILWGKSAQEKCDKINTERHLCLKAPHPSPFSAYKGFLGSAHFSQANKQLEAWGKEPIRWEL